MAIHHELIPKVVKLEPDIKDRLDRLGEMKHRTPHWLMKEAITRYLEQEEYREQLKQETLARWQEAESGKVISNETMIKWLDTWGTEDESNRPPCGS
jgi:predicted transcriptional regulator